MVGRILRNIGGIGALVLVIGNAYSTVEKGTRFYQAEISKDYSPLNEIFDSSDRSKIDYAQARDNMLKRSSFARKARYYAFECLGERFLLAYWKN